MAFFEQILIDKGYNKAPQGYWTLESAQSTLSETANPWVFQSQSANWDEYVARSPQQSYFVEAIKDEFEGKVVIEISTNFSPVIAKYASKVIHFQKKPDAAALSALRGGDNLCVIQADYFDLGLEPDVVVGNFELYDRFPDTTRVLIRQNPVNVYNLCGRNEPDFSSARPDIKARRVMIPCPDLYHTRILVEQGEGLDRQLLKDLIVKNARSASAEPFYPVASEELMWREVVQQGLLTEYSPHQIIVSGPGQAKPRGQIWAFSGNRRYKKVKEFEDIEAKTSLFQKFVEVVNKPYWSASDIASALSPWAKALSEENPVDFVPQNFCVRTQKFFNIDQKENIPRVYNLFRGVLSCLCGVSSVACTKEETTNAVELVKLVCSELGTEISDEAASELLDRESELQASLAYVDKSAARTGMLQYQLPSRVASLIQAVEARADYSERLRKHAAENAQLKEITRGFEQGLTPDMFRSLEKDAELARSEAELARSETDFYKSQIDALMERRLKETENKYCLAREFVSLRQEDDYDALLDEARKKLGFLEKGRRINLGALVDFAYALTQKGSIKSPGELLFDNSCFHISPHPCFDPIHFSAQESRPISSYVVHPYLHFLLVGSKLSLDPHPLLVTRFVRSQGVKAGTNGEVFTNFLESAANPHPLFDAAFYKKSYSPEGNALSHFLLYGSSGCFDPNPEFSSRRYLSTYADVFVSGANPLTHWVVAGEKEGRKLAV